MNNKIKETRIDRKGSLRCDLYHIRSCAQAGTRYVLFNENYNWKCAWCLVHKSYTEKQHSNTWMEIEFEKWLSAKHDNDYQKADLIHPNKYVRMYSKLLRRYSEI